MEALHHVAVDERRPRRILHVFSTFAVGGPQRRFAALTGQLAGRYRHAVIALDGRVEAASLLAPNAACDVLSTPRATRAPLSQIVTATRTLLALRPDLLVTYNWGAIEWAAADLFARIPHVHIEDGFGPEEVTAQLPRRVLFRRLVLNRRSTVVLPSRTLMGIAAETWKLAADRRVLIPNGVAWAKFQVPIDLGLKARLRGQGPVIGTLAALRKEKALDRLLDTFARIFARRPARLVIAGDGPERKRLEEIARARGLADSITFLGNTSAPERILSCLDLFAITSDTEQMPLSVLEAMSAGQAIVGTDVGDVREMVAPENRRFIVATDPVALTDAATSLLDDHGLRRDVGEANRRRAQAEFDESRMIAAYDRIFAGRASAAVRSAPFVPEPFPSTPA